MAQHMMYSGNPTAATVRNPAHIYVNGTQVKNVYVNNALKASFHVHTGSSGSCYESYSYTTTVSETCGAAVNKSNGGASNVRCSQCGAGAVSSTDANGFAIDGSWHCPNGHSAGLIGDTIWICTCSADSSHNCGSGDTCSQTVTRSKTVSGRRLSCTKDTSTLYWS